MMSINRVLRLAALLPGLLLPGLLWAGPFSLEPDRAALYRLYSGDKLIGEFATKEEVDAAAINAVRSCTEEVNYVYTETVAAENSECGEDDRSAPADTSTDAAPAPADVMPNETKAAKSISTPPETKEAPAGKPPLRSAPAPQQSPQIPPEIPYLEQQK